MDRISGPRLIPINTGSMDLSAIGSGGMSATFTANQDLTGRSAALKLVNNGIAPASVQLQVDLGPTYSGKDAQAVCEYDWNKPSTRLNGQLVCSANATGGRFNCSLYSSANNAWPNAQCAQKNNSSKEVSLISFN